MIIKTSELDGAALDWAVTKSQGLIMFDIIGRSPSTDWSQGGPLIEKYIGATDYEVGQVKEPFYAETRCSNMEAYANGKTILIAAMRAIVASKLGDEVDVPDELVK